MATKAQERVMMAMYPASPIKTRGSSYNVNGTVRVARSTFFALVTDGYIIAADSFLNNYILTAKGTAEVEKAFAKILPRQQEMIMVPYRYCFNSYGMNLALQITTAEHTDHIPTIDGYRSGDKLTLAYEDQIAAPVNEKGCEQLYHLFNAPFERPNEYRGPSMSIGDVITFFPGTENAVSFACDRVGFVKTDISGSEIEGRPARWIRNERQMREYLADKEEATGVLQEA